MGSSLNDSSTIRATPSARGEPRISRNFSISSSARSEDAPRPETTIDEGVDVGNLPSVRGRVRSKRAWSRAKPREVHRGLAKSAAKSRLGVYSYFPSQFGRGRSAKSWHDRLTRPVPILLHSEDRGFV